MFCSAARSRNRFKPSTNSGRSIHSNTAGGRRTGQTLSIANGQQARTVQRFIRGAQVAGLMVMAWDLRGRSRKVRSVRDNGGDYRREQARQYTGFALGGAAGSIVVRGAIAIGLGLTPAGWVLLIGASVIAFAASTAADSFGQDFGEFAYDRFY